MSKTDEAKKTHAKLKSSKFVVNHDTKTGYVYMNPIHPKTKEEMEPTHTIIFLHAMRSSAINLFPKFNDLGIVPAGFRVVLPQAPIRSVKALDGKRASAWFDQGKDPEAHLLDYDEIRDHVNQEQLIEQSDQLLELVKWEKNQFKEHKTVSKIFIGGLQQGCCVALSTFLRYDGDQPLAGIVGINGFQALNLTKELQNNGMETIQKKMNIQKQSTILLIHGEKDPVIICENAFSTYSYFQNLHRETPRKCKIEIIEGGENDFNQSAMDLSKKWLIKQAKLSQGTLYFQKAWSLKFKFMIIFGTLTYLTLCYAIWSLRQGDNNEEKTEMKYATSQGYNSDL